MLRNYLITALRHIVRNPVHTLIQVLGMTVGLMVFLLIILWVKEQIGFDRFNENLDNIYRLEWSIPEYEELAICGTMQGPLLKENLPDVADMVRFRNVSNSNEEVIYTPQGTSDKIKRISVDNLFADSTYFNVFSVHFIQGNPARALCEPNTIVLTKSIAAKIFEEKDPMGEVITFVENGREMRVTGIINDVNNTSLPFEMLSSFITLKEIYRNFYKNPELDLDDPSIMSVHPTYLLLSEHHNKKEVETKAKEYFKSWMVANNATIGFDIDELKVFLRPLKDVYFNGAIKNEAYDHIHGNLKLVYSFAAIAIFILLLSCINFINISLAVASLRAKEVGVRKVGGSSRLQLVTLFLGEILILVLLSFVMALLLAYFLLPAFNNLVQSHLDFSIFLNLQSWLFVLIGILLLSIIAGFLPAMYLSSFQPMIVLKGLLAKSQGGITLRRILMLSQYIVCIVLIIGTLTVLKQIHYMKNADVGFDRELRIHFGFSEEVYGDRIKAFKDRLLSHPNILNVTHCFGVPGEMLPFGFSFEFGGLKKDLRRIVVDPDYLETLGISLVEGRNFSEDRKSDFNDQPTNLNVMFNESAVNAFNLDDPLNSIGKAGGRQVEIIGVVDDFHFSSLKNAIEPTYFVWSKLKYSIIVNMKGVDITSTIDFIGNEVESIISQDNYDFKYSFLDESYDKQYKSEERFANIFVYFALLAILIASMGLYGLSSFMALRRTKEMGIRKANGASTFNLFFLLSSDFLKWILLSMFISIPISWYFMNRWLREFAYRTNMGVWVFIAAGLIILFIVMATVTWQSLKTAGTNPTVSLRYE